MAAKMNRYKEHDRIVSGKPNSDNKICDDSETWEILVILAEDLEDWKIV